MAKAAAKPKEDEKTAQGADAQAAPANDLAAADAPPAAPARLPGVLVNGLQLREAMTFLAPDGTAEQLAGELVLELMQPADAPGGLYAYYAECPEEGSILLTGEGFEVVAPAAAAEQASPAHLLVSGGEGGSLISEAARDVLVERLRQVEVGRYMAEHDDALTDYQLPRAAACYVLAASGVARHKATLFWPFKPPMEVAESRRRNLVKAAALILAELERIDREAEQG